MGLILSALVSAYMKADKVQRWAVPAIVIFCLLTIISFIFIGESLGLISVTFVALLAKLYRWLKKLRREQEETSILNELTTSERINDEEAIGYDGNGGRRLRLFTFASLMSATDDFSTENKLGQGGFGPVFKGKLPEGKEIAVKKLMRSSGQGLKEFKNELILIAGLQHTNLVRLLGFCVKRDERMLVYEYMPNKSLDYYLFDQTRKGLLDWKKRYTIIEGISQGLIYLHKYSRLPIIHRDLKPGNILLDADMSPKISDFGLARIFDRKNSEANTNRIAGTLGYMSLEYAMGGKFSEKSDVYSFGVLLLEIISGRKISEVFSCEDEEYPLSLVGHAWELWKEGRSTELKDSTLEDQSATTQIGRCIHVGLLCIQDDAAKRPTMSEVIPMIANETLLLPDPEKPLTAITRQNVNEMVDLESGLRKKECFSINEASISEMEPR